MPTITDKTGAFPRLRYSACTMGVVGRWDQALFERFRKAADRVQRTQLLGELARTHNPLVLKLTRQLKSDETTGHRGIAGSERLTWLEALSAARVAEVRALQEYDTTKGGDGGKAWPTFLKWKILDELQRAIQESAVVMRGRRRRPPDVEYFDNDDELEADVADATGLQATLESFLTQHCRFAAAARVAACEVRERYESFVVNAIASSAASGERGRYESILLARDQAAPRGELARVLLERGARRTMVRVPWEPAPVRGFAGVRLQDGENAEATRIAEREASK